MRQKLYVHRKSKLWVPQEIFIEIVWIQMEYIHFSVHVVRVGNSLNVVI